MFLIKYVPSYLKIYASQTNYNNLVYIKFTKYDYKQRIRFYYTVKIIN